MSDDEDNYDYDDQEDTLKNRGTTHCEGVKFDTFISKGKPNELSFEEKFEYILEKNVLLLDFEEGKKIIPYVMQSIKDTSYMMFKNPLAFLFGYYVVKNKTIDVNRVTECIEMCKKTLNLAGISISKKEKPEEKEEEKEEDKKVVDKKYGQIKHVTAADIIRYARLIIQTSS